MTEISLEVVIPIFLGGIYLFVSTNEMSAFQFGI